jgi:uncharacterized protein (TIGR02001 family)
MKKIISSIMGLYLIAIAPTAMAEEAGGLLAKENFSANVAYTTNYLFRGISLSNENSAVSGGFDYGYNGFYLGTWASSISPVDGETLEIDLYAGYGGEFKGVSYSLDVIYYGYPGMNETGGTELDYIEFGGSLGYTFGVQFDPTIGVSVLYSDDFFAETDEAVAITTTFGISLPYDISVEGHYGHQALTSAFAGVTGYDYYGVDISKSLSIFDFTVGYSDTDSKGTAFALGDDQEAVVFTVSSSF